MALRCVATLGLLAGASAMTCKLGMNTNQPGYKHKTAQNWACSEMNFCAAAYKEKNPDKCKVTCERKPGCAVGFSGNVTVSCPAEGKDVKLAGCKAFTCKRPTTTAGYILTNMNCKASSDSSWSGDEDGLQASGKLDDPTAVSCRGHVCATGYHNTTVTIPEPKCTKDGADLSFTGCAPNKCVVNSGMSSLHGGIKYFLDANQRAATKTAYDNLKKDNTTEYNKCATDAGWRDEFDSIPCLEEISKFLVLDNNDREYVSRLRGPMKNKNARALMAKAVDQAKKGVSEYAGLLVTAASVENTLVCDWTGPWGKIKWAAGVADYKEGPDGLSAVCPAHNADMVLAGCVIKKNCTTVTMRTNMVASTEKPCGAPMLHKESCEVACAAGFVLKTKKFDTEGKKIKNYPVQPYCADGKIFMNADCEAEADLTPIFIIIGVVSFLLPGLAAIKYFREVAAYNKQKSEGCTWNGKGEMIDASGEKMVDNPIAEE